MKTGNSPLSPDPAQGARDGDLPAFISNGCIGLRVREVPLLAGLAIVGGVVGLDQERRIEAAAPCPYPLAADLAIDGVWMTDQPWAICDITQNYDFATAELTSEFKFHANEKILAVTVVTFASRTAPTLVLQSIALRPSAAMDLKIKLKLDTGGLQGIVAARKVGTPGQDEPVCDGSHLWITDGNLSSCGLALCTEINVTEGVEKKINKWNDIGPIQTTYSLHAPKNKSIEIKQIAALLPSLTHERPEEEAVRRVARGQQTGFDELRKRNREAWAEIWEGRIVVHGATKAHQRLIDAAFFYLNSSVHGASLAATSIFGLASWHNYHYYYGHVMWDIDTFCTPVLTLLQPDAAKAILDFRTRGLDSAKMIARLSNRQGIQFPWEAAPMSGQEASPGEGAGAAHEDHGTLHVARAFSLYADATGEPNFLEARAWPVLSGTADWIVSRAEKTKRGYEIKRTNGPAETPMPPNNDAFTNMVAKLMLRKAIRVATTLEKQINVLWESVEKHLFIPQRKDGVVISHDDFKISEPKGATPSPLAAFFPYDFDLEQPAKQRTLEYYLSHWQNYVGSPMLPALYPVWAVMNNDRDLALKLFEEAYVKYDSPRFHQCLEYRSDHEDSKVDAGPFFANLGGMLLGLLLGFTGLVIDEGDPESWARRPIVLPAGWKSIEIGRVWIRGKPTRIIAKHGAKRAEFEQL